MDFPFFLLSLEEDGHSEEQPVDGGDEEKSEVNEEVVEKIHTRMRFVEFDFQMDLMGMRLSKISQLAAFVLAQHVRVNEYIHANIIRVIYE